MPNIKEIALRLAAEKYSQLPEEIMDWLDDIIAELAKGNEPVAYLNHYKGAVVGVSFTAISNLDNPLFALPPTASQIEQETAEAVWKAITEGYTYEEVMSGAWKEFK